VPMNMGMFAPEKGGRHYENPVISDTAMLDARDFPSMDSSQSSQSSYLNVEPQNVKPHINLYDGNGFDLNQTRFNPRIDPRIEPGIEKNNKYNSQYRVEPQNVHSSHFFGTSSKDAEPNPYQRKTDQDPRNKYILTDLSKREHGHGKNYFPSNEKSYSVYEPNAYTDYNLINPNEKLAPQTRYGDDLMPTYSSMSEMDMDNKMVIPNIASRSKKELNSGTYRFEPYLVKGVKRDSEMEDELVRGMPSSRVHNRSYGYRNPQENYFDYIDEDYQNPKNSCEGWIRGGEPTRLDNKTAAKNRFYSREVM
jgi:hypothetical protein